MTLYCDQGKGGKGRPKTTLPVVLWAEGKRALGKLPSLEALNELAKDKLGWRDLCQKVIAKSHMSFTSRGMGIQNRAAYASKWVKQKWIAKPV